MNKRIIPCLDIQNGRVVKGKKFQNVQEIADPADLAEKYEQDGADILFMLDIDGKDRKQFLSIVQQVRQAINLPLYVGGGIRTLEDMQVTLDSGADKIAVTSAAIDNRHLLRDAAERFGSEALILSIDAKRIGTKTWHAFTAGGQIDSGLNVPDWAVQGEADGASEILLNSIDADGIKVGYDLALNQAVASNVTIPVIASGGAGRLEDFQDVFAETDVDAALAASVFHYDEINIASLKTYLERQNN